MSKYERLYDEGANMRFRHDENMSNLPSWSNPWVAGWSAMSDTSRIEIDTQSFRGPAKARHQPKFRGHIGAIGLGLAALAVSIAVTILL